jgi:hypothetical protein
MIWYCFYQMIDVKFKWTSHCKFAQFLELFPEFRVFRLGLTKPDDDSPGTAIDVAHALDLVTFLDIIALIDAYSIYPKSERLIMFTDVSEGGLEMLEL